MPPMGFLEGADKGAEETSRQMALVGRGEGIIYRLGGEHKCQVHLAIFLREAFGSVIGGGGKRKYLVY